MHTLPRSTVNVEVRTMLASRTRVLDSGSSAKKWHDPSCKRVLGFTIDGIVQAALRCGITARKAKSTAMHELHMLMCKRRTARSAWCGPLAGGKAEDTSAFLGEGYAIEENELGEPEACDGANAGDACAKRHGMQHCYGLSKKRCRQRSLHSNDVCIGLTVGIILLFKVLLSDTDVAASMRLDAFFNSAMLIRQTVHTQLLLTDYEREEFRDELSDFEHGLIAARVEHLRYGDIGKNTQCSSSLVWLRQQLHDFGRYAWSRNAHSKRQHMMCCAHVLQTARIPAPRISYLLEWVERAPENIRRGLALKRVVRIASTLYVV
jgi:hypothetical protein